MDEESNIAFPILDLPRFALERCIKAMDPFQLINFAECTDDTASLAKSINYEKNVQIIVEDATIFFEFLGNDSGQSQKFRKDIELDQRISQAQLISELFHSDISKFEFSIEDFDEEYQWLQNRQKTIDEAKITGRAETEIAAERMYSTISDGTLQIKKELSFEVEHHPDFEISPSKFDNISKTCLGRLQIVRSQWFKSEHLVHSNVSKLWLINSEIPDVEVNRLLKLWKSGGELENLKTLNIIRIRDRPDNNVIVEGLSATYNSTPRYFDSDRSSVEAGWDFRRDTDGKQATLVARTNYLSYLFNSITCFFGDFQTV